MRQVKFLVICLFLLVEQIIGVYYNNAQGETVDPLNVSVFVRQWDKTAQKFVEIDETIPLNRDELSVVIIHGMCENVETSWVEKFAIQIEKVESKTNIIAIDWSKIQEFSPEENKRIEETVDNTISNMSDDDRTLAKEKSKQAAIPFVTAYRIPDVAKSANVYLFGNNGLHILPEKTYLIGFSHGAHVAGMIGMTQKGKIKRITLLDVSTIGVHLNPKNLFGTGWDKSAANFIDMYGKSNWAGSDSAIGDRVFVVHPYGYSKSWTNHLPNEVAKDHIYIANWFLTTIGDKNEIFGYSAKPQNNKPNTIHETKKDVWSGLIVSSFSREGRKTEEDDNIKNQIFPFPKVRDWHKAEDVYNEAIKVTNIVVERITINGNVKPDTKATLEILLQNKFDRNVFFNDGTWGFANKDIIPVSVWLSNDKSFDPNKKKIQLVASVGLWGSSPTELKINKKDDTTVEGVIDVLIPKKEELEKIFGRSNGEFFLHVKVGTDSKLVIDIDESDNCGLVQLEL
jgi:hypothetical protein